MTDASVATKSSIVAVYPYLDEQGRKLFETVRLEPKKFIQRRRDENDIEVYDIEGVRRVLFKLNKIQGNKHVYIVEGEKDVLTLCKHGLPATCNPMGAGNWMEDYSKQLVSAGVTSVTIFPDNHETGFEHARQVASSCLDAGIKVKIVNLPDLPSKGDVTDWFESGHTPEELARIVESKAFLKKTDEALWPEPLPLRRELPAPEQYPIDALGDVLGPAARKINEVVQSPMALCAQSLLAAAALAVQAHADVEIDGRTLVLSEFFITVAESGERKTSTDKRALSPHHDHQRTLQEDYRRDIAEFKMKHEAWKKGKSEAFKTGETQESRLEVLKKLGPEPIEPLNAILFTREPTYEGLVLSLMNGMPSMGLFNDEGGRFVGGHALHQDNLLKTCAGLSEFWDGTPIIRTRVVGGNIIAYGKRLSLHLMVQPEVSFILFGNGLISSQGFLSRCLVSAPASTIGARPYQTENLSDSGSIKIYSRRIKEILQAPYLLKDSTRNELDPRHLSLSPEAKKVWVEFHDEVESLSFDGQKYSPVKGFAAKSAEHALRLAGILTLVENFKALEIPLKHMYAGIKLSQFYLGEALRLFGAASINQDLVLAENALEWAKPKGDRFSLVDLYQIGPNAIRDKATAKRITQILIDHHWIREVAGGAVINGVKRQAVFEIRP